MRSWLIIFIIFCFGCSLNGLYAQGTDHSTYVQNVEKGFISLFKGENANAVKAFEAALAIEPNHYEILHYLGMAYAENESWNKAVEVFQRSIDIKPDNIEVLYSLSVVYFKLNQWENAVEPLQKVTELSPRHARGFELLGKSYVKLRQYAKAIDVLKEAIKLRPNAAQNYNEIGTAYLNLKQYTDAIENFTKAVKFGTPDFADPHFGLGTAYMRIGEREKSKAEMQIYQRLQQNNVDYERFTRLTRVDPNNLEGWSGLAKVLMRQKKYNRAILTLQTCIELSKKQKAPPQTLAGFYHALGQAFINMRYPKLALEPVSKAAQLMPKNALFFNTLGSAYAMIGDINNAIAMFEKAVELDQEQPYYHLNLSKLYQSIGRHQLAKEHQQLYQDLLAKQNKTK